MGRGCEVTRRGRQHLLGHARRVSGTSSTRLACSTDLTGWERGLFAVRSWSNTGRGADYHPLLGSKRSRAEEQNPRSSRETVESLPRSFVAARSYWFTSPLFARRDRLSSPGKDIPEGTGGARVSSSASSKKAVFFDEGDFLRIGYEGVW